jgi:hypothetical protein
MLTGTLMILCAALFAWLQTPERETRPSAAAGKLSSALYGRRLWNIDARCCCELQQRRNSPT